MKRRWIVIPIAAAVAAPASAIAGQDRPSAGPAAVQARPTPQGMLEGFARQLNTDEQRLRSSIPEALRAAWADGPPSRDRPLDPLRDRFLVELAERLDRPADRVVDAANDQIRESTAQAVDAGMMTDEQRQEVLDWWRDPDSGPLPRLRAQGAPNATPTPATSDAQAEPA